MFASVVCTPASRSQYSSKFPFDSQREKPASRGLTLPGLPTDSWLVEILLQRTSATLFICHRGTFNARIAQFAQWTTTVFVSHPRLHSHGTTTSFVSRPKLHSHGTTTSFVSHPRATFSRDHDWLFCPILGLHSQGTTTSFVSRPRAIFSTDHDWLCVPS